MTEAKNHKRLILETLKREKDALPTSRLSAMVGLNAGRAKDEFEDLRKEGLVKKIEERIATYWEITKKGIEEIK